MLVSLESIVASVGSTKGISDVHLHEGRVAAIRVNGEIELVEGADVTPQDLDAFFKQHLTEEQLSRVHTKGDADLALVIDDQRYRASFARGSRGRAVILRKLDSKIPTPEALNLPPALLAVTQQHSGLVLVTGPTGSGKSTSLAALIGRINEERKGHILTVEDPIEYIHEDKKSIVFQREIGKDAESFAQALKAALREDPDVILVGELRDLETVSLALTAAETGHLVFATLHTNGAPSTINRIIDVFPAEQQGQVRAQLAQTLRVVMTQRLYKRLDGEGRVGAFEVMVCNNAVRNLIREAKIHQIESIMQTARGEGMQTMDAAVEQLVSMGMIRKSYE
jgi:twitching motility protein PilT